MNKIKEFDDKSLWFIFWIGFIALIIAIPVAIEQMKFNKIYQEECVQSHVVDICQIDCMGDKSCADCCYNTRANYTKTVCDKYALVRYAEVD